MLSLDCEFTVVEGRYAKRKFWQLFTVAGGKLDDKGTSIGWNISKRIFRAMIDSALGLDPVDERPSIRHMVLPLPSGTLVPIVKLSFPF